MAVKPRFLPLSWKPVLPPRFLCPALAHIFPVSASRIKTGKRHYGDTALIQHSNGPSPLPSVLSILPLQCPGCGAFTQDNDAGKAGYYSTARKSVKTYLAQRRTCESQERQSEAKTFDQVLQNADQTLLQSLGVEDLPAVTPESPIKLPTPVCNRCHDLIHHHAGAPIVHPTLDSIQAIISESPYKYNHVYHVLDAADFPLSLIPRIQHHLSLNPQRSLNRRSKQSKYYYGRMAEMSFIITRSDLLAPKKEQVDRLMPYLIEVLRDALGQTGRDIRLGNVRCVSSKRGWWTKEVKEAIWERGGGGWMVGKVNVGKSNLFECIFPKGRNQEVNFQSLRHATKLGIGDAAVEPGSRPPTAITAREDNTYVENPPEHENRALLEHSLLPPAPPEERFPVMPIVSSLPGTTASPIRLLFGSGKGELVDLPGLAREQLEDHVLDEHKDDLVMRERVKPDMFSIKPGQSLLIGGLIRLTPTDPNQVLLAYPFVPLKCHVTSTEKAIGLQTQQQTSGVPTISKSGVGALVRSAGLFSLDWDVTKQRSGPLTRPSAVGLKPQALPFVIYSADLLIEGCGWVELVVQVRRSYTEPHVEPVEGGLRGPRFPEVEVFSPHGKYVGIRRPMNAWLLGGPKPIAAQDRTTRPRRSMKGVKKNLKRAARAAAQS